VIDPSTAYRVCHGFKLDDELMLWSRGIVGTLSDSQEKLCQKVYILEPVPPALVKRHEEFSEIAHTCSQRVREEYPKGERLLPYLECMSEEAEKRGFEI